MIKSIIFDFGDVFINLDKTATALGLKKLGIPAFTQDMQDRNDAYEKGQLSTEEFITAYLDDFPELTRKEFISCWNAVLKDFPQHRLDFLNDLCQQNKYRLILLSNTNELHIDWVKKNVHFFEHFYKCFEEFFLSQEINHRKPEESIFQYIIDRLEVKPEEALFIDDTRTNTEAASKLGFHTWNINPVSEDVADLFVHQKNLL